MSWDVTEKVKQRLPEGHLFPDNFTIEENEDELLLYFAGELVGTFGHSAKPEEIAQAAREYLAETAD